MPAILDYVQRETGHDRVNWVGHSLGGMLIFPYLELSPHPERIANFVGMGSTIIQAEIPQSDMLAANRGLRVLSLFASPGRLGRPLAFVRLPGMERIDRFYYSTENVDRETISRFYGYTLEDTGPGALRQLDPYLEFGHMLSADRTIDYSARLGEITTPTLLVAGDGDIMSDVPSTELTFAGLGSPDKAIMRFGKSNGHVADYGHCDLVWSRHAPIEIFPPIIDWLDQRQPGTGAGAEHERASAAVATTPQKRSGVHILLDRRPCVCPLCRNESTQICDQVSNSLRISQTVESGRNSASARPSSRGRHVRVLELEEMDDPEVDLADGRGVVVDQPDPVDPAGTLDLDLLVESRASWPTRRPRGSFAPRRLLPRRARRRPAIAADAAAPRPATCRACNKTPCRGTETRRTG